MNWNFNGLEEYEFFVYFFRRLMVIISGTRMTMKKPPRRRINCVESIALSLVKKESEPAIFTICSIKTQVIIEIMDKEILDDIRFVKGFNAFV